MNELTAAQIMAEIDAYERASGIQLDVNDRAEAAMEIQRRHRQQQQGVDRGQALVPTDETGKPLNDPFTLSGMAGIAGQNLGAVGNALKGGARSVAATLGGPIKALTGNEVLSDIGNAPSEGGMESLGRGLGDMAQMEALGAASVGPKVASKIPALAKAPGWIKAAIRGGSGAGGVTLAQTGDPKEALKQGGMNAALSGGLAKGGEMANTLGRRLAVSEYKYNPNNPHDVDAIENVIRPAVNSKFFGADPKTVNAANAAGLDKASMRRAELDVAAAATGKTVSIPDLLHKPTDEALGRFNSEVTGAPLPGAKKLNAARARVANIGSTLEEAIRTKSGGTDDVPIGEIPALLKDAKRLRDAESGVRLSGGTKSFENAKQKDVFEGADAIRQGVRDGYLGAMDPKMSDEYRKVLADQHRGLTAKDIIEKTLSREIGGGPTLSGDAFREATGASSMVGAAGAAMSGNPGLAAKLGAFGLAVKNPRFTGRVLSEIGQGSLADTPLGKQLSNNIPTLLRAPGVGTLFNNPSTRIIPDAFTANRGEARRRDEAKRKKKS